MALLELKDGSQFRTNHPNIRCTQQVCTREPWKNHRPYNPIFTIPLAAVIDGRPKDPVMTIELGTEVEIEGCLYRIEYRSPDWTQLTPILRATRPTVTQLLSDAVTIDGAHHKQWYLERIAQELEVTLPEHDAGTAP